MKKFDWLDFCNPCKSWCCHGENPFASEDELKRLDLEKIGTKLDGSCVLLDNLGKCSYYENRPFECRIFPLDIQEINGDLSWVVWNACPATPKIDYEQLANSFEANLSKNWDLDYIRDYVTYHKSNQPEKYSASSFRIVKKVNWSGKQ